jgi:hypothetical protein
VVGVPAAAEHRVQLLPGLLPGQQAVHRVRGYTLGRMDCGGISKTGRDAHIITRQPDDRMAADVPDREVTVFGDVGDHPAFPVSDPVGGREAEASVVGAGDDHIADAGVGFIPETHFVPSRGTVKAMITGSAVELSDGSRVGASMIASSPTDRS